MKLLLDMNLRPAWIRQLRPAGFEVVHWTAVGEMRAPDPEIMKYARREGYTILTRDLDFGTLLAAGGLHKPSVVQIRTVGNDPVLVAPLVIGALAQYAEHLENGCLLTVTEHKSRVRALPFML